jgi:polyvinyl alcohol dehydrogenase (cytochrome)
VRWAIAGVFITVAFSALAREDFVAAGVQTGPEIARAQGPGPGGAQGPPAGRGVATELGFGLFQQRCLACHGNPAVEKAPPPAALREMSPERILDALTAGAMKTVGDTLTPVERRLVAESVAGRLLGTSSTGDAASMPNRCPVSGPTAAAAAEWPSWNGWGANLANTRFQPAGAAGLTAAQVPRLRLKWAFGFPNGTSSYGQPTIAMDRVFVGTDTGYVYALGAKTGCVHWSFQTKAGVRNAPTVAAIAVDGRPRTAVLFGDVKANVYAVDASSGEAIWTTHVEDHYTARVTGAPAFHGGRLYVPISSWEEFSARSLDYPCCTSRGAVAALDAATGRQLWKTYVVDEPKPVRKNAKGVQQWAPAGASIWNSPTIDPVRGRLYVGTGDATTYPAVKTSDAVVALELDTGRVAWSYQVHENDSFLVGCAGDGRTENCPQVQGPDWDIPASVVLRDGRGGGRYLLVGTKPGDILALDPDRDGALRWRVNVNGALADNGPLPPGPPPSGVLWGFAAGEDAAYFGLTGGAVAAVDIATGAKKWHVSPAGANARVSYGSATSAIPGVVFQGGSDGVLLALSAADGATLWRADTNRPFETVNRVSAKGGSISAPGPTIAGGMVFVGSGYAVLGGTPGNVLLAFGL